MYKTIFCSKELSCTELELTTEAYSKFPSIPVHQVPILDVYFIPKKIFEWRPQNLTKISTTCTKHSLFSCILSQSTLNHVFGAPSPPSALGFPPHLFFLSNIPTEIAPFLPSPQTKKQLA